MVEVNNRLCHACSAIFSAGSIGPHQSTEQARVPPNHIHHVNLQSFRTAVGAGCFICSMFGESRGAASVDISSDKQQPFSTYFMVDRGQIYGACMLSVRINQSHATTYNIKPSHHTFEIVKVDEDKFSLNTPPTQRLDLLSRWVSDCCESNGKPTHTACQHYRETAIQLAKLRKPSKLLELGTGDSRGSVRLVSLDPAAATPFPPYVTLGSPPGGTPSLPAGAIESNSWVQVNQLPKMIQDALAITQHVGARFLWTPDLAEDADNLLLSHHHHRGDIISSGLLHIAPAAHKLTEEDGILPPADRDASVPVVTPAWPAKAAAASSPFSKFKLAILDPDSMTKSLAPLTASAQAYHDNFLAPATLYCTDQQHWWQCRGGAYSETFPSGFGNGTSTLPFIRVGVNNLAPASSVFRNLDDSLPTIGMTSWPFVERLTSLWTQVVCEFSATTTIADANQAKDRMSLVDSMATHLRDLASPHQPRFSDTKTVYRAGLWFAGAGGVHQLLWHTKVHAPASAKRVSGTGLPTWSWMSTTAPAEYSFYLQNEMGLFPLTYALWPGKLLDEAVAEVEVPPNHLGEEATTAALTLRGRLVPIEVMQDNSRREPGAFSAVFFLPDDARKATCPLLFDAVEEEEVLAKELQESGLTSAGHYFALPLTLKTVHSPAGGSPRFSMQGLVLRPRVAAGGHAGNDGGEGPGVYTRCGWFHCDSTWDFQQEWKDVDVREALGLGGEHDRETIVLV